MNKFLLLSIFSVFISSVSQILLKIEARKEHENRMSEYLNINVILSYGMLVAALFLNIIALRGIDLKMIPMVEALGYVFVFALSICILKEKATKKKLLGIAVILAGILIFNIQ